MLWLILSCVLLDYAEGFIYPKPKDRRSRKQKQTRKQASIMKTAISFFNSRVGKTDKNIVNNANCWAIFEWKCIFDHLFLKDKSKASRWNKAKYLFMCYFTCQAQTITNFLRFNLLGKIRDGGEDCEHVWWHYRPLVALHPSCGEDERLSTERNFFFEIIQHIKNSRKGLHQLPLAVQWRGYDCAYFRGETNHFDFIRNLKSVYK